MKPELKVTENTLVDSRIVLPVELHNESVIVSASYGGSGLSLYTQENYTLFQEFHEGIRAGEGSSERFFEILKRCEEVEETATKYDMTKTRVGHLRIKEDLIRNVGHAGDRYIEIIPKDSHREILVAGERSPVFALFEFIKKKMAGTNIYKLKEWAITDARASFFGSMTIGEMERFVEGHIVLTNDERASVIEISTANCSSYIEIDGSNRTLHQKLDLLWVNALNELVVQERVFPYKAKREDRGFYYKYITDEIFDNDEIRDY